MSVGPGMTEYVGYRGCGDGDGGGGGDGDVGFGEAVGFQRSCSSIGLDLVGREASIGGSRGRAHSVVLSLVSRAPLLGG